MILRYLEHSAFSIETEALTAVFDYTSAARRKAKNSFETILNRPGKLYVFCSHSHPDHFSKEILEFKRKNNIVFIFSDDIKQYCDDKNIVYLKEGETYDDGTLKAKAFGSTDVGVSFAVQTQGKTVFHAGDLNFWHWMEESTKEEVITEQQKYSAVLDEIYKDYTEFDLVMFPVDPRLGKEYMLGAEQFIKKFRCKIFSPMHFWGDFKKAGAFEPIAEKHGTKCLKWIRCGQAEKLWEDNNAV